MKKVLTHPLFIVTVIAAFFIFGTLWGRHTTDTVLRLKEHDDTGHKESNVSNPDLEEDTLLADKININTASADTLSLLPGIGPSLAERIIAYRTENGPFSSIDELMNVDGLGQKRVDAIRVYIVAGGTYENTGR